MTDCILPNPVLHSPVLPSPVLPKLRVVGGCFVILLLTATSTVYGDYPWQLETSNPGWQARDSQGELVFGNKLWIFGGWFDSFSAPPRDVWSSANGKDWSQVAAKAPWIHSDLPMTMTFKDHMWIMGGWYNGRLPGHSASNQVWSSKDGVRWKQVTKSAGWSPRLAAASVVFRDRMWILGGIENYYFGDQKSLKNDVWSSKDGKVWKQHTVVAPWAPRAYHQAAVFNDRIYLFGGGNYLPQYEAYNDVWSSNDGVTWRKETSHAEWAPRLWFSSVVYRKHLWVLGGWSNRPSQNWNDVWYSKNGKTWRQLLSPQVWKARHEHSAFVLHDKIWVAGGHAKPLSREVWSLQLPKDFPQ